MSVYKRQQQLKRIVETFAPKVIIDTNIPIIEISDTKQLCKDPVVSVLCFTYNHEAWLPEALDSVVTQIADFPYEIIICEDYSTDGSRAICLEYQKKYPDKIRILCAAANTYSRGFKILHEGIAASRGEFGAFLETDDLWCDVTRLQRQVNCLRVTKGDLCVADTQLCLIDNTPDPQTPILHIKTKAHQPWERLTQKSNFAHLSSYLFQIATFRELANYYIVNLGLPCLDQLLRTIFLLDKRVFAVDGVVSHRRNTSRGIYSSLDKHAQIFMLFPPFCRLFAYGPQRLWHTKPRRLFEKELSRYLVGISLKECSLTQFSDLVAIAKVIARTRNMFRWRKQIRGACARLADEAPDQTTIQQIYDAGRSFLAWYDILLRRRFLADEWSHIEALKNRVDRSNQV